MCRQTGRRLRMVLANLASELELELSLPATASCSGHLHPAQLQIGDWGHLTIKSCSADPLCRSDAQ